MILSVLMYYMVGIILEKQPYLEPSWFLITKIPEHYDDGFDFTLEKIDGSNLNPNTETDRNSLQTKVFNSDYVEENLFLKIQVLVIF